MRPGRGIVTGTNDRSVLIGAYRLLRELGCAWVYPGEAGERVPKIRRAKKTVSLAHAAFYRRRNYCIEGASSYNHVLQMIERLPKAGMNGYFNEFIIPYAYFDSW
jgi:hypothetical protein